MKHICGWAYRIWAGYGDGFSILDAGHYNGDTVSYDELVDRV